MKESMYRYMRLGLIYSMAYPAVAKGEGPIEETIRKLITDDYFNAIEITWIKDGAVRTAVKRMLDASHMTVTFGAHPMLLTTGLNINDPNEKGRQKALTQMKAGIDEAVSMGAETFTFLSGKYEEGKKQEAYDLLVKSTMELCRYAKSKGKIKVVLEVFDYDVDKKSLIGPAKLAAQFAEEICREYDNFGITVDLSHIPLIRETIEEAVLPVKDYLVHAHIGNCVLKDPSMPGYGDVHPRFGFPNGENDIDELALFLKLLLKIGFLNEKDPPVINFEVKPQGDEDPDIIIANSKRTLNLAWARI